MTSRVLKPSEAGDQIGASENHVYRLIACGALRAVDIAVPGSRRSKTRIREDDLLAFIESRTRGSPTTRRDGSGLKPPSRHRSRRTSTARQPAKGAGDSRATIAHPAV